MQNEKKLLKLMKESYPMEPNEEFQIKTLNMLQHQARKGRNKKNRPFIHFAVGISLLCTFLFSLLILQNDDTYNKQTSSSHTLNNDYQLQLSFVKDEPLVFIYQTHNFASFLPELSTSDHLEAYDESINVTSVGKRLSELLNKKGITTIHNESNHMVGDGDGGFSLTESNVVARETLTQALNENDHFQMVFDIRRDTQKREETTVKIKGVNYSRIAFNVSRSSGSYEQNLRFAHKLNEEIEAKYPGISRGVFVIEKHGEQQDPLNQDMNKNSLTVVIGGYENTLDEEYRAGEIFAEIIAGLFLDDV